MKASLGVTILPLILDHIWAAKRARILPPIPLGKNDRIARRHVVGGIAVVSDVHEVRLAPNAHRIPIAIIAKTDEVQGWDNGPHGLF